MAWEVGGDKEIEVGTNSIYDTIIIPVLEMGKFEVQRGEVTGLDHSAPK